jgi:ABC-2 type transport system permease protein
MLYKFISSVKKESRLLLRDKGGLAILFVMPVFLIIIMSMLQEAGFKTIRGESKIKVLFLDMDQDSLGAKVRAGLEQSGIFDLVDSIGDKPVTAGSIRYGVQSGDFPIGVVIPSGLTKKIRANVRIMVMKTMAGFGLFNPSLFSGLHPTAADTLTIFFDPAVKLSFKSSIVSAMKQFNYETETEMVFSIFSQEMTRAFPAFQPPPAEYSHSIAFKEVFPGFGKSESIPDTAQHNVPAWAVFAMFFIIIPLTSGMIQEREQGSMIRLLSLPVSYTSIMVARVFVYMLVCFLQVFLMVLTGIFLLPLFGISALHAGNHFLAFILITMMSSLAALGFGILVGTVADTHQQAAAFGSVSIVIMAATGGLWVPVYLMSPAMQTVASLSPLNWALNGYYDVFLRGGGVVQILPESLKLLLFAIAAISGTALYWKFNNPMRR